MEAKELLAQGLEFERKGDRKQAREFIARAVKADPSLKQGWWALAHLLEEQDQRLDCLKKVLKLDPADEQARAKLAELQGQSPPDTPPVPAEPPSDSQEPPSPRVSRGRNRYVYRAVAVVGVILVGALLTWLVASGALQGLFSGGQDELANLPVPTLPAAWTPTPEIIILVPTFSPTASVTPLRPQSSPTITKTSPPSPTPRPFNTATITPTFDPQSIPTMTPASPATCPQGVSLGALTLTHPTDDWYAPAEEILQYLNDGGSLNKVERALADIDNFYAELHPVDLTNDGVSEIVLHAFAVYVFQCQDGQYAEMLRIQPEILDFYGSSMTMLTRDLNLNGVQDLIVTNEYRGMNNYTLNVLVYEWDGEDFATLIPDAIYHPYADLGRIMFYKGHSISMYNGDMELQDVDRNGTIEIILKGGTVGGYVGAYWSAPQRSEIHTWMWNGEEFNFYDVSFSPASLKIHVVQEGDLASLTHKYEQALDLYWRAINDASLEAWNAARLEWTSLGTGPGTPVPTYPPPDPDQVKRVEAYARFRIMVTNYLLDREAQAETQYQLIHEIHPAGDPGYPYAQMAKAFYDAYQSFGSIAIGCNGARAYAIHNESEILYPLGWMVYGEANMSYSAEDICPFW